MSRKLATPAFQPVWDFEERVAAYTGARHAVAVDCCTNALFLAMMRQGVQLTTVWLPARTYLSVPMAVKHAGAHPAFVDYDWQGAYELQPLRVWDAALTLTPGMFNGETMALSFQARKPLPIGRGGMLLTNNAQDAEWYRRARACGRDPYVSAAEDAIAELGWNMIMTPEQAARGLLLLDSGYPQVPTIQPAFPDLRRLPVFKHCIM